MTTSPSLPPSVIVTSLVSVRPATLPPANSLACALRSVIRTRADVPTGTSASPCTVVLSPLCKLNVIPSGDPKTTRVCPLADIATSVLDVTVPEKVATANGPPAMIADGVERSGSSRMTASARPTEPSVTSSSPQAGIAMLAASPTTGVRR